MGVNAIRPEPCSTAASSSCSTPIPGFCFNRPRFDLAAIPPEVIARFGQQVLKEKLFKPIDAVGVAVKFELNGLN